MSARKKVVIVKCYNAVFSRRGTRVPWADVYYEYWGTKGGRRKKYTLAPCIMARTDIEAMRERVKGAPENFLAWEEKFIACCDRAAKRGEDFVTATVKLENVGVPENYVTKKVVERVGLSLLRRNGVEDEVVFKYIDPKIVAHPI